MEELPWYFVRFNESRDFLQSYLEGMANQPIHLVEQIIGKQKDENKDRSFLSGEGLNQRGTAWKVTLPSYEDTFRLTDFREWSQHQIRQSNETMYRVRGVLQVAAHLYGSYQLSPESSKKIGRAGLQSYEGKIALSPLAVMLEKEAVCDFNIAHTEGNFLYDLLQTVETIRLEHIISQEYPGLGEEMAFVFREKLKSERSSTLRSGKEELHKKEIKSLLDDKNIDIQDDVINPILKTVVEKHNQETKSSLNNNDLILALESHLGKCPQEEIEKTLTMEAQKIHRIINDVKHDNSTLDDSLDVSLRLFEIFKQKFPPEKRVTYGHEKAHFMPETEYERTLRNFQSVSPISPESLHLDDNIHLQEAKVIMPDEVLIPNVYPGKAPFVYNEWNCNWGRYVQRKVLLYDEAVLEDKSALLDARVNITPEGIEKAKNALEMLIPEGRVKIRRLTSGVRDLSAIRQAKIDLAQGRVPSDKLYYRWENRQRDVAIALLIDLSKSGEDYPTRACLEKNQRAIDAFKESAILFTSAAYDLGDDLGVFAFNSTCRRGYPSVHFYNLKDFGEELSYETIKERILSLKPGGGGNRDGAAIRHLTNNKFNDTPAATRVLFFLGDGMPKDDSWPASDQENDNPVIYLGEYAIKDTRKALEEARLQGIIARYFPLAQKKMEDEFKTLWQNDFKRVIDSQSLTKSLLKYYVEETL